MADSYRHRSTSQKDSHIPISSSPKRFSRTGSLKLKNESRPKYSMLDKPDLISSSPIATRKNLRRHRSLQCLGGPSSQIDNSFDHDDADSEKSFGSSCNSVCGGHSPFAHNGTTYSSRNMKYIFHCSPNTGSEEYLTPTQRANRTIKRLRQMLAETQSELIEKENEIAHLTKEVVELRLLKADSKNYENSDTEEKDEFNEMLRPVIINDKDNSMHNGNHCNRFMSVLHEENDIANQSDNGEISTNISDDVNNTGSFPCGSSPHRNQNSPSLADSGHFDDINYSILHNIEKEYEKLKHNYDEMREKHNEKVEQLLRIIADSNDKYYELKPKFDTSEIKIKELEKKNEELLKNLSEQQDLHKTLCLQLYTKQEEKTVDSIIEQKETPVIIPKDANDESWPNDTSETVDLSSELVAVRSELEKLKVANQITVEENNKKPVCDADITIRFLKSAIYYFLTDPSNARDHLSAIESMLGYSDIEKSNIERMYPY